MKKWNLTRVLHSVGGRVFAFVLCACLLLLSSLPVNALDVSLDNARVVNTSGSRAFFSWVTNDYGNLSAYNQSYVNLPTSHRSGFYLDARLKNSSNNYFYLESNTIFVYYITTNNMVWRSGGSSDSTTRNVGCKEVGNAGNYTTWECYAINYDSNDSGLIYISNQWERAVSGYEMEFTFGSWTQYKSTDTDYTSILNSINSNTSATASNLNSLSSLVDALKTQTNNNFNRQHDDIVGFQTQTNNNFNREHDDITALSDRMNRNFNMLDDSVVAQGQATQQSIDNQTQQQEEQYDNEKQEESDREEQGNADSSQLAGIFNFTAFNPFSGLFGLFTSAGGCINIPIVGGMLNKSDATYCPWFPSTIRNILTPVIGLSAMMIIFGFFISWLNGGDSNGTIEVKQ